MGAAAYGLILLLGQWLSLVGTVKWLLEVAAAGTVSFLLYLLLATLLRISEIQSLPRLLLVRRKP